MAFSHHPNIPGTLPILFTFSVLFTAGCVLFGDITVTGRSKHWTQISTEGWHMGCYSDKQDIERETEAEDRSWSSFPGNELRLRKPGDNQNKPASTCSSQTHCTHSPLCKAKWLRAGLTSGPSCRCAPSFSLSSRRTSALRTCVRPGTRLGPTRDRLRQLLTPTLTTSPRREGARRLKRPTRSHLEASPAPSVALERTAIRTCPAQGNTR